MASKTALGELCYAYTDNQIESGAEHY